MALALYSVRRWLVRCDLRGDKGSEKAKSVTRVLETEGVLCLHLGKQQGNQGAEGWSRGAGGEGLHQSLYWSFPFTGVSAGKARQVRVSCIGLAGVKLSVGSRL